MSATIFFFFLEKIFFFWRKFFFLEKKKKKKKKTTKKKQQKLDSSLSFSKKILISFYLPLLQSVAFFEHYPQGAGFAVSGRIFNLHRGWPGVAMVSCILRHWGVQLILAYSWARPAIIVAGKGTGARGVCVCGGGGGGGMFLFLLFLHFHSCSLSSLSLSFISSISFLPFSGRRHKMTHKG